MLGKRPDSAWTSIMQKKMASCEYFLQVKRDKELFESWVVFASVVSALVCRQKTIIH